MKSRTFALLLTLCCVAFCGQAAAPLLDENVRKMAADRVDAGAYPSLVVGLVRASARDEFFYKVVDAQLSFQRAGDGSVESVVLHQNGQHVKGAKQAP